MLRDFTSLAQQRQHHIGTVDCLDDLHAPTIWIPHSLDIEPHVEPARFKISAQPLRYLLGIVPSIALEYDRAFWQVRLTIGCHLGPLAIPIKQLNSLRASAVESNCSEITQAVRRWSGG